ncbi:MAG: type II toxin-antitoxin system death-on-curing family toxin [Chloroflexi bacterium]|nr:type II toxin-antitoxin system death-on-curing family toxin [Chloroflexota bacterium]
MSRREPIWLSRLAVDEAHVRQIREHGGPRGIRDEGALEAALARPRHRWSYEPSARWSDLAAAYGFGIVQGHPFVDGNKRVGLVAMVAFLYRNGLELMASDAQVVSWILAVAAGRMAEAELAALVEVHVRPDVP